VEGRVSELRIEVDIGRQQLLLRDGDAIVWTAPVSTAANGPGEQLGSERTPRGRHYIRAKIGAGCAPNTVFVGRRPTGEMFSPQLRAQQPGRDWILTRILWLSGLEPGVNRLGTVDTMRRYIYIHGCPDDDPIGVPGSHGCIKMRNADIVRLFDAVGAGTRVDVRE
jgi:L,D-transpeptidase YbiS